MSPVSNTWNRTSQTSLRRPTPMPSHQAFVTVPKRHFLAQKRLSTMSPLRRRSLWGRKAASLQRNFTWNSTRACTKIWVMPVASSARPAPWLRSIGLEIRPRSTPKSDWGMVRAWCCLSVNPVVSAGLLHSILLPAQDCPGALPAARAWSRSCPITAS